MATASSERPSKQDKLDKDLWYACMDGDIARVKGLIRQGATLNYKEGGKNPLQVAAHMNHSDIVELLVKTFKPDIENPNERGITTLHMACAQGQASAARSLIKHGANIDCQTDNGKTPFFLSCHVGNLEQIKLLIQMGANRNTQSENPLTPLEIARNENHTEVVEYLTKIEQYESSLHHAISDHHEEEVEIAFTKFSIHGAPGSGKTCLQHLLNNDPPPETRESTDLLTDTVLSTTRDITTSMMTSSTESGPNQQLHSCGMQRVDNDQSLQLLFHQARSTLQLAREDSTTATDGALPKRKPRRASCLKRIVFKRRRSAAEPKVVKVDSSAEKKSFVSYGMLSVLPNAMESDNTSVRLRWIYGTDSGGQHAYQDIAPAFLRHCSVVILTLKLNERLNEYPKFEYMHKGQYVEHDGRNQLTNLQMILTLARSLSSILQPPCGYDTSPICRPKLMIVGTFLDQISSCTESLREKNHTLEKELEHYHDILIRTADGDIIHPVNTLLEDGRQTRSEELCKALLEINGSEEIVKMRISQLMFQFEIVLFAESRSKEILTIDECFAVGRSVQIYSKQRVEEALKHLDRIGFLFYFHKVLPKIVFVKPQAILKYLSDLISFSFFKPEQAHTEYTITSKDHQQLCNSGCFSKSLLLALFRDHSDKILTIDGFIELMEHLLVLVKVPTPNHPMFFLPCVLPWEDFTDEAIDALLDTTDAYPIRLAWKSYDDSAIPYGIFLGTVNALLSMNDPNGPKFCLQNEAFKNRRNAIFLQCISNNSRGCLLILDRVFHLELRFKGQTSECCSILRAVQQCIQQTAQQFHYHSNLGSVEEYFFLPCKDDCVPHRVVPSGMNAHYQLTGVCHKHNNTIVLNQCQVVWLSKNNELIIINLKDLLPLSRQLVSEDIRNISQALQSIVHLWFVVGVNLGLDKYQLEVIRMQRRQDPIMMHMIDVIELWLKKDCDCTTNGLISALEKMVNVKIVY